MTLQGVNHIGICSQWDFGHFIVNISELKMKKYHFSYHQLLWIMDIGYVVHSNRPFPTFVQFPLTANQRHVH